MLREKWCFYAKKCYSRKCIKAFRFILTKYQKRNDEKAIKAHIIAIYLDVEVPTPNELDRGGEKK